MKPHLLPLLGAFAAGIGATLAVQSLTPPAAPDTSAAASSPSQTPAPTPAPIGKTPDTPEPVTVLTADKEKKKADDDTTVVSKTPEQRKNQRAQWQKRWQQQMRGRTQENNRVRLDYLAEELGLTPEQVAQIDAALNEKLEESLASTNGGGFAALAQVAGAGDPMENALTEVITPEQELAYTELKEKERAHKVEARTMQRFARLPETLNLSEQQRDQIYDLFAQEEAATLDNQSPAAGAVTNMISVAAGGVISEAVTIDIGDAVSAGVTLATSGEADANPQNAFARMREAREKRNEERAEAMSSILDERQLEAYRSHLNQNAGFFGSGGGNANIQVEVLAE